MKLGILSDIHSNYSALENCLRFFEKHGVDHIYFLGDSVDYLPYSEKVFDILKKNSIISLLGNHDAMVIGALPLMIEYDSIFRTRDTIAKISKENSDWLKEKYSYGILKLKDSEPIFFTHGTPKDPITGRFNPNTDLPYMKKLPCKAIFMGHTHYPFLYKNEDTDRLIVNVGSCGWPRDIKTQSCFAIYDTDTNFCEIHRIPLGVAL